MFFSVVGENVFVTFLADVLGLWTLDLEMILEVFIVQSHSATLWAGLHLLFACMNMLKGITILGNT